jgi:Capsule assembly protein Wzi/PAP2 superfamily
LLRRANSSWVLCTILLSATFGLGQAAGTAPSLSGGVAGANHQAVVPEAPPESRAKASEPKNDGWLPPGSDPDNRLISPFVRHIVGDQKRFWTTPTRLQVKDLKWIVPLTAVTGAFIASDSWWARQVPASHVSTSKTISNYTTYSFIALGGSSFLFGQMTHDDHLSESGLLAGEGAIDATAVAYVFKEVTQRKRPYQGNGNGSFFTGGTSFPSEHSAIAWSVASVWAHEYPGWFSQMAAYGLATAVSATRVTAKQHFPSDAIIGSALGWYFGRQVYRAHHDPELGGSGWGSLVDEKTGEKPRNPNYMASPYVPLDSWIYPALERLIAMGYVKSGILGMRPWTRMQCARLVQDAEDKFPDNGADEGEPGKVYATLTSEFGTELARLDGAANVDARVESVYTRSMSISGTPLRDGYHFGQTIINDYARPYWTGFNEITGLSADAETGPVSFYFRGEYQHAPAMLPYPPSVLAATAAADGTPLLTNGTAELNRFQLLDSMASFNINNVQISVGNQSAWLGPGESGPLLMSNNAAPFPMVKIDDIALHEIPGLSRILGPFRSEFFVGQLSGQQWELCQTCPQANSQGVVGPNINPQPFIHGEKISFQPTPNLEFGMGVAAMFGGPGLPVTFGNFFRTYYIHTSNLPQNPGKRTSAADFTYRIPRLRDWLTLYMDSLVWDEISPIGSTRANVNPGVYLPKIPRIPKLQLRAEGFNVSRTTHNGQFGPGWVYYNADRYRSGYTSDGNLLGSWIGRAGRGGQGWVTYSFSPRNNLSLGYRLQDVSRTFIQGGRLADYSASGDFRLSHHFALSGLVQYEQWRFPVLSSTKQSDVTASLQLTYYPKWQISK